MPPKRSNANPNIIQDVAELQKQVKSLNEDVHLIYNICTCVEKEVEEIKKLQQQQHMEIKSMLNELFSNIPSTSAAQSIANNPSDEARDSSKKKKKIIPAPCLYKMVEGKRRSFQLRIVKEHILEYVIKPAFDDDFTDEDAEATYRTMRRELAIALDVLEQDVREAMVAKMAEDDQYRYIYGEEAIDDSMIDLTGTTWSSLPPAQKKIAISQFEDAVFDETDVNLSRCENHWASEHMFAEAWRNRIKPGQKKRSTTEKPGATSPPPQKRARSVEKQLGSEPESYPEEDEDEYEYEYEYEENGREQDDKGICELINEDRFFADNYEIGESYPQSPPSNSSSKVDKGKRPQNIRSRSTAHNDKRITFAELDNNQNN
ncbi:hypothetical protein BJV82DRAFT_661520 [Fennellomyces sp. T-0311]|nr:hypothetical protein BJV82DRAFT_661520 [Fennellomyces sp. T-0311]